MSFFSFGFQARNPLKYLLILKAKSFRQPLTVNHTVPNLLTILSTEMTALQGREDVGTGRYSLYGKLRKVRILQEALRRTE
jgi:hypothetical protein